MYFKPYTPFTITAGLHNECKIHGCMPTDWSNIISAGSLQAISPGRSGKKDGELATTSLEFEFHLQFPSGSPSTELSDLPNQRKAERTRM